MGTWSSLFGSLLGHEEKTLLGLVLSIVITVCATVLSSAALWKLRRCGTTAGLPPGPRGLPLIGYLPFLGTDLRRDFERLSRVYGPIFKLWLGQKLCVVVASPELVKEVVRDQDTAFANRDPTVSTLVGSHGGNDIAFGDFGPEWKKIRKVFVREIMSNTVLDNLYGIRREEVHKSLRQIYRSIDTPVNLGNLSFETATNSILNMVCRAALRGKKVVDAAKLRVAVGELVEFFGKPNVSDFFPAVARFDLQGIERGTKKVFDEINNILDAAVEHQRAINRAQTKSNDDNQQIIRKDFLQFLLELHDERSLITTAQLKALLQDTLVAGTDTTTTMVEWTMAELLKNPEAMSKVHEELTQVVGLNNMVEESHLSQLTYLNAAIKETHRLHPALPLLIPRRPIATTTLGGYKVPKDTKIFLNIWAIQRDPKIWDNPLEFRPERFLQNNEGKFDYSGNNFHFLPFGSGRRICAGLPLAERMVSYTLASFLHSFEWKFPRPLEELEMSDRFGIVVKKLESLVAIPTPRLSNLELYS